MEINPINKPVTYTTDPLPGQRVSITSATVLNVMVVAGENMLVVRLFGSGRTLTLIVPPGMVAPELNSTIDLKYVLKLYPELSEDNLIPTLFQYKQA